MKKTKIISEKISNWIKEQVEQAGQKGVVVGLSGGVDSAVVSVLSKRSLGDNVLGIIMPCHSNSQDEEDAIFLANEFDIKTEKIALDYIYDKLLEIFPKGNKISEANLKPRLRMLTLYYFANKLNYLVAGTGNRSEITIGYYTKYGDGGVDILPIGGLLKTEVLELAKELKIPKRIIEKVPSAGLWEGQTDEGEMGIPYPELDRTIVGLETGNLKGLNPKTIEKVRKLMETSNHKRAPIPTFIPQD